MVGAKRLTIILKRHEKEPEHGRNVRLMPEDWEELEQIAAAEKFSLKEILKQFLEHSARANPIIPGDKRAKGKTIELPVSIWELIKGVAKRNKVSQNKATLELVRRAIAEYKLGKETQRRK